jgi:UDP-N-acetylglucosamine pyrophosphorylase
LLDRLLSEGFQFLFVSNSDNLGATLDGHLLSYFAESGKSLLMEVAQRTGSDRKGGHLARRDGKLLLRESAQCPETDQQAFQDIQRHRFFNTNNLWVRLDALRGYLASNGGFVPLPLIKNSKNVDPRDKKSISVFQLETAMGAAIECFDNTGAILVPRSRFAPVKTTSDLFALRSDAYEVTSDWRLKVADTLQGTPPRVDLEPQHYGIVDQLDRLLEDGVPSLKHCQELIVRGPVRFGTGQTFRGQVTIENPATEPKRLPEGQYADTRITL